MTENCDAQLKAGAAEIISIRRDIHAHPELAFEEQRTSDLIAKTLSAWGIPVDRSLGRTGVVGILKGRSDRAIGLRADMDALPISERNSFAHASVNPGTMHACGHDGHTAMLLMAAKRLASHHEFDGTVYLVFQPAEEGGNAGAREMIKDGLFERFPMEAIFGVHNWPGLEVGHFALSSGAVFASSSTFRVVINARSGHAGIPHQSRDPVPVACHIVQAFQTIISRNKRPHDPAVISVTIMRAGEAVNVIPGSCEIKGTVRAFKTDVLDMIQQRMGQIAEGICQAFETTCDFEFRRFYPPTVNHPYETQFVRSMLERMVGKRQVHDFVPTMVAEDFSFYLESKPGCYFLIGNGRGAECGECCALHSPTYEFNDSLIPLGGEMWTRLVDEWFMSAIGEH